VPHILVAGLTLLGVCMALLAWAEGRVDSGVAATLGATVPMFLGLLDPGGLDRKGWTGLGVGFLGVMVLLWPGGRNPTALAGAGVLVLSAFLWASATLYGKRHAGQGGHYTQIGIEMLAAGVLSLVAAPLAGGLTHGPLTGPSLMALGYLILFGSILAYSAYIHLSKVWSSGRAGTYAYWNPVVAVLLGCWLRREAFQGRRLVGLALILLGVALVQIPWRGARKEGA
jgi:drug/metabolite transporter (DMT)-like permease